eukprot:gene27657-36403_t
MSFPLFLPLALVAGQVTPAPPPQATPDDQPLNDKPPVDSIPGRRRPGYNKPLPDEVTQRNIGAVRPPPPTAFPTDQIPVVIATERLAQFPAVREAIGAADHV